MFVVDSVGLLLARVQSWLRIVPVSSLVMLTWSGDGEDGVAVRLDLADAPAAAERLALIASRNRVTAAALVFVDAEGMSCRMRVDMHMETAAAVIAALSARSVTVLDVVVAESVGAGGQWRSLRDADRYGVVGDSREAPLMGSQCRVYRDHEELVDMLAVDRQRAERVGALMGEGLGAPDLVVAVAMAVCMAQDLADGVPVEDWELAVLGGMLTNGPVRDRLYALSLTGLAKSAEDLWLLLSRVLPFPWRAEALVLLAVSAYMRGDGLLVRQAVEVALAELPEHRMATMLAKAVSSGCPPEVLARAVGAGAAVPV